MNTWKELKIEGIARIDKCVAEFNVLELNKTPYSKFKVKIYERSSGLFCGFTNLGIKDESGDVSGECGFGNTVEEALKNTVLYFLDMLNEKEEWSEEDFECSDPFDF